MADLSRLANVPQTIEDVLPYLREGMPGLIDALGNLGQIERITHVAPQKPQEGMLRFADGTNWNPGSGAGLYRYTGGSWVLIMGSSGPSIYAPIDSPLFTGNPRGPTPTAGDNSTRLATTAFVSDTFAAPPVLGSTTPAAARVTKLAATSDPTGTPDANTLYKGLIPRAWGNVNMTNNAIRDSFNVAGINDMSVGHVKVVWDRDFANADYVVVGNAMTPLGFMGVVASESHTAGDVTITCHANNTDVDADATVLNFAAFGDQ